MVRSCIEQDETACANHNTVFLVTSLNQSQGLWPTLNLLIAVYGGSRIFSSTEKQFSIQKRSLYYVPGVNLISIS